MIFDLSKKSLNFRQIWYCGNYADKKADKQVMIKIYLITLTQYEKTGSIGKNFFSLGNLIIRFQVWKLEVHVF